mmetsp:Transcript_50322/g.109273  ORF Transcript_50322/g.109273 Transcript_50322/m.109273 type:complete len:286 (+) Transcript_50322:94-951(+)
MYLANVLTDIREESAPPRSLSAEHLFKLNEAVFNLPEEDKIDKKLATQLFQTVKKIRTAYNEGKYNNADSNFFYDYLALLGTMQNQHFFSTQQTDSMLSWIMEVVGESGMGTASAQPGAPKKDLQAENTQLKKQVAKLEASLASGKGAEVPAASKSKGKASEPAPASKGKGKGKAPVYEEPPLREKKGKGKGKDKSKDLDDAEEKGKGKSKGKGKGKSTDAIVEVSPDKGKAPSKGKGKEKAKGKGKAVEEEAPPLRDSKGKGAKSAPKSKGKGKSKGWKAKEPE